MVVSGPDRSEVHLIPMEWAGRLWWQRGVIYQIYPRSFQDSNGDGIGDLRGILARIDYLATLGINAVWISPFYPSPMADFGYDVADYCDVDPIFGTLADFDALAAAIHARGLKLILDFVPNHTSDRHPWFVESRGSRGNPKREWYIWRDAVRSSSGEPVPPNNWLSHFGGPAWTFDAATGQYYLHSFLPQQPDVNWRNPEVRAAIYQAMLFWLDRGVDGFRMDVLWLLIKDALFRDNPPNPEWRSGAPSFGQFLPVYTADRPETHEIVTEMRLLLDSYPERVLIGEIYLPIRELVRYYGSSVPESASIDDVKPAKIDRPLLNGAQLPFNFHLIQTPWNAAAIARLICDYEAALPRGAWPNWVLGNHDQSRLASRVGPAQARVAAMLLLTLRGTPTLYYGDELGMPDGLIPPDRVRDPAELNQPGIGMGRDPERTPMLWENSTSAGFTSGTPWLPIAADFASRTVQTQDLDPASVLTLYRTLLALRRSHAALHSGSISAVEGGDEGILNYVRSDGSERLQVLLNLTSQEHRVACPPGRILLSTDPTGQSPIFTGELVLRRDEGVIVALD